MADILASLNQQGFCLVECLIGSAQVEALRAWSGGTELARSERGGETYGARNLLGFPLIRETAALPGIASCLSPILGADFRLVRGLFFDKTPGANWPVAWHQDLSLAVQERYDLHGWGNWSVKRGVPHVQPPAEILGRMVTLRLHLDDCPAENGALRVLPGSHRNGLLSRDAIAGLATEPAATVAARAGDGLLMRPPASACLFTRPGPSPPTRATPGIRPGRSFASPLGVGSGLILLRSMLQQRVQHKAQQRIFAAPYAAR